MCGVCVCVCVCGVCVRSTSVWTMPMQTCKETSTLGTCTLCSHASAYKYTMTHEHTHTRSNSPLTWQHSVLGGLECGLDGRQ